LTACGRTIRYRKKDRKPDGGWGHFKPSRWGQCKPSLRELTADGLHALSLDSLGARKVVDYVDRCIQTQRLNGRILDNNPRNVAGFKALQVVPDGADVADERTRNESGSLDV